MKKILVLMFHPRLESSNVNKFLMTSLLHQPHIVVKDMYELYPDFNINVKAEQQDLLEADLIVIQHPFFWYAAPPLVKQWIDLVLEHGWAYGKKGNKLKDKNIMHIISSGGGFETYCSEGKNSYTYNELLRPFELTYRLCQMEKLPPYIIPKANKLDLLDLEKHCSQIKQILRDYITSETDFTALKNILYLNELK
ncbi:Glutathione-regulated potassium-efflux system ancillary protein KefG [Indibacter alkaliphilus LW1]|uniref:Glutathione-regulated potassium-efflux system ancillary protein KefG n=1 Tax=Indibacter alkaliphilus (strain CCUG 57479 / KCTC 22604 / LW1) TaxID=1189612 RepID=S2E4K0_INDAL|nr:NAD(P)H-dependent oxidoreductase [Indibacter alkaliphilus]EOZ97163.1 Glutathione-regulated potassium-efflux system ancillary protein KefG [Indibacter alkaliphilus LW1]